MTEINSPKLLNSLYSFTLKVRETVYLFDLTSQETVLIFDVMLFAPAPVPTTPTPLKIQETPFSEFRMTSHDNGPFEIIQVINNSCRENKGSYLHRGGLDT